METHSTVIHAVRFKRVCKKHTLSCLNIARAGDKDFKMPFKSPGVIRN